MKQSHPNIRRPLETDIFAARAQRKERKACLLKLPCLAWCLFNACLLVDAASLAVIYAAFGRVCDLMRAPTLKWAAKAGVMLNESDRHLSARPINDAIQTYPIQSKSQVFPH